MRAPGAAATGPIGGACAEQGLHVLVQQSFGFLRLQASALAEQVMRAVESGDAQAQQAFEAALPSIEQRCARQPETLFIDAWPAQLRAKVPEHV